MQILKRLFTHRPELTEENEKGLFLYNLDWMLYHDFINIDQYNVLLNKGIAHFNLEEMINDQSNFENKPTRSNLSHANRI
jgi:hypothetical protein